MLNDILYTFRFTTPSVLSRDIPYSCAACRKPLAPEDFAVLPTINELLYCPRCYHSRSNMKQFRGGYLVDILNTVGIGGYAFSHSASLTVRAIGYNSFDGLFLIRQRASDIGVLYETMPLPPDFPFEDHEQLKAYENSHSYHPPVSKVFHPFLLHIQFFDVNQPNHIMLSKLKSGEHLPPTVRTSR